MGSTDEFCLRWNDFEANISSAFRHLRNDPDFFDVSLACRIDSGGEASDQHRTLKAHKVILSSCSPYFRSLLREQAKSLGNAGNGVQTQIPYIVMRGVSYNQLSGILDFMYYGEANVAQEELDSFLALAEELQVKGLTQSKGNGSSTSDPAAERGQQQPTASGKKRPPPPPAAANAGSVKKLKQAAAASSRSRSPTPSAGSGSNFQGIKTESTDAPFGGGGGGGSGGASAAAAAAASEEASGNDNDGYYDSFGQDESRSYDDPGEGTSGFNEDDKGVVSADLTEDSYQDRLSQLIRFDPDTSTYFCTGCTRQSSQHRQTIVNHVESVHLQIRQYQCSDDVIRIPAAYTQRLNELIVYEAETKTYRCVADFCDRVSDKRYRIVNHVKAVHLKVAQYPCKYNCNKNFFTQNARRMHYDRHHAAETRTSRGSSCSGNAAT